MSGQAQSRRNEQGLALVSVLWALSILSLIAAAMMSTGTLSYIMERNSLKRVQANLIADAAINRAILGLLDTRPDMRWRVDSAPHQLQFGSQRVTVTIQDQLGLIDLNEADASLLTSLFQSVGLSPEQAGAFADRIIDWRSIGDLRSLNGANSADYLAAGFRYLPRDGSFQTVNELKLVLGMTPDIFSRVAPAVTVYSQRPQVDPNVASKEVLLALPGTDAREAQEILRVRASSGGAFSNRGIILGPGVIDPSISLSGRTFGIDVKFTYSGLEIERTIVVRVTGDANNPVMVMARD